MVKVLIGKKKEMSQIYGEDGSLIPVTIIEAGPCPVMQVKTVEGSDGYNAYRLAFDNKKKNVRKPQLGEFTKAGIEPKRVMREFRFDGQPQMKAGDVVTVEAFVPGDIIDVTGTSKGRGFQGSVKRHGFHILALSHGGKMMRHGSVGQNTSPGRVHRGKRMSGHMGDARITARNLTVVRVVPEKNLLYVRGAVPGHPNADVVVHAAVSGSRRKGPKSKWAATS